MSNPYRALLGELLPIALEASPEPVYPFWKNCVEAAMSVLSAVVLMGGAVAHAEEIGSVDTAKTMIGPNHRIAVEAFDDPKVAGVACHLSRAITGGAGAAIGISEDTSTLRSHAARWAKSSSSIAWWRVRRCLRKGARWSSRPCRLFALRRGKEYARLPRLQQEVD